MSSNNPGKEVASPVMTDGIARQASNSSSKQSSKHDRDGSRSSDVSVELASPASGSSAEAQRPDGTRTMKQGRSAFKAPPAVVLCTIDGVQLNAIEVGGISSGAALRERMLSRVHVADDEMAACTIHWGPLGEVDELGEALNDEELLAMCRDPSSLPNFHAFTVRNNGPLAYAPSGSSPVPGPSRSPQPSPPILLSHGRASSQFSDNIVHNYMLSNHPEEGSDDEEDVSQRQVTKSRTAQTRRSDPVPFNGRTRSDSDPNAGDRRQYQGRLSADFLPPATANQRPPSFDEGRRQREQIYFDQDERARRAEFDRMQNQRPSTASGSVQVPRPVGPPSRGIPYALQPQGMPVQRYPPGHLPPPPQQRASNGMRPVMPVGYTPPRGPPGPSSIMRQPSYPIGSSGTLGPPQSRPVMPAHSVEDMRTMYSMQRPPQPLNAGHYPASRPGMDPRGPDPRDQRGQDPRGPRLDPRFGQPGDPRMYADGRHTIGPRSMTPTPRSAPLPSPAQFPNPQQGPFARQPSQQQQQGPPMDPRRMPRHSPPMTAPPYTTGYGPPPIQAPAGRGQLPPAHRAMSQPVGSSTIGPGQARPPAELMAGQYMAPRVTPARSPTGNSTPNFDARIKLPLQPGEVLQDALTGGTLSKRAQTSLPRIETNHVPSELDRRTPAESVVADVSKRPSPATDRPPSSAGGSRRPSGPELEPASAPAPVSPAYGGHTPSSSSSSSASDRLGKRDMPESLIPGRQASKRNNEEASSPRKSEDESSTHTFSSGRPSSRSSQTSLNLESPVAPPPPACPAAPSAPELWEDDLGGASQGDASTWVSPESSKHRKSLSVGSEPDDQSRTARQKDWLRLDLGSTPGSLGLLDSGTLRANKTPGAMPSDDAFDDDFDDDVEASTWAGPRRSSGDDGSNRTARPTLTLQIGDAAKAATVPAKVAALRQMSKGPSSSSDSSSTPRSSALPSTAGTTALSDGLSRANARKTGASRMTSGTSPIQRRPTMRGDVRPSAEQVYDNLDVFFPNHDLDKPILVDAPSSSGDSPSSPKGGVAAAAAALSANANSATGAVHPTISRELRMARHKSIRVVAKDRAKQIEQSKATDKLAPSHATSARHHSSIGEKLSSIVRRKSTKLWGRKIEEVTPSQERGSDAAISVAPAADTINEDSENFSFKIIMGDLIGKGSYGKVYLGINITTGDMLAVKQVELPKTASDRDDDRQTGSINALKFEIETLKDLDHPHIVQYLGFEQTLDHLSIFLEYIPGGSVGRWVRKFGKFGEDVVQSFTHQILDGLAYLHNHGILHRDLKADNCLVDGDGIIRISDFGISKKSSNVYEANEFMSMQGSIFWMAPEVVHNAKKGYSAKVDIWSLGCVVLEMFAGRRPWDTEMAIAAMFKIGAERLAPPVPDDVKLSPLAETFLSRCFIVDPQQRPTAEQLMKDPLMRNARTFDFKTTALGKAIAKASHATPPASTPSQSQNNA